MWKDILKARQSKDEIIKELLESIITTTPKPIKDIFDELYDAFDKRNEKYRDLRNNKHGIPTRKKLQKYLRSYSKVLLSNATGKPVKHYVNSTAHYYKEE